MAVLFDAASNNGTPATGNFSWTHTPVGTPRAIVVSIVANAATTDEITSVSYGASAMTQVSGSPLIGTAGAEDGVISLWMLGSSVPTGAQTVSVVVSGSSAKRACAISCTANADVILDNGGVAQGIDSSSGNSTPSCGSMTWTAGRTTPLAIGTLHTGDHPATNVAPDTSWTQADERAFPAACCSTVYGNAAFNGGAGGYSNVCQWTATAGEEAHTLGIMLTEDIWVFAVGQATETDSAFAATVKKSKAVGQATESDSGLATGKAKSKAVAQATETDAGLAATAGKSLTLGQATETDAAQAAGHAKAKAVGLATESDSGLAAGKAKSLAVGQASETDAGQALGKAKSKAVGLATESDEALAATVVQSGGGQVIALGIATESDSGLSLGKAKVKAVGQAVETDAAMALGSDAEVSIGLRITPGLPMWPVGIGAVPLPAGKFRITWGYDAHGQGAWPHDFQVYEAPVWDVPLVDSETGLNVVAFDARRKQFSFTTGAYAGGSVHAFGVRARNSAGVAERNTNATATVTAKTVAPSSAKILQTMAAR